MTKGKTLAQIIRTDKRVEDLSHDDDGWWCYLAYGIHTYQGRGSHLIHEDTLTAVLKELRQYKRSTHSCDCEECVKALA